MSEIDQQFIEYVVKSLVGKPDAVQVNRRIDEKGVLLELTVDPEDLGRVIGKRGATAQSLRTLLRALGTKNDARYNLKIIDNGVGGDSRDSADQPAVSQDSTTTDDNVVTDSAAVTQPETDEPAADEAPADESEPETSTADSDDTAVVLDEAESAEAPGAEDETSDRLRRTREELADLDDLDV